jgi:hypothetical protein
MQAYLRSKLKGKKIQLGQTFTALYLGKESTFTVASYSTEKDGLIRQKPNEESGKKP